MQTNTQLQLASDFIQSTGQNMFLTGKAGTGKTTFLNTLREKTYKRMVIVAPTGVAAINAGGVTIHSLFQLSFAPQIGREQEQGKEQRFNKEKINIIRSLDLLVIDEISMVRADVLDAIDRILRRFRWGNKPFGGVQLLMIGDLQQLTPVVKSEEWGLLKRVYDTPYFFSSKVLRETSLITIELKEVFRQQDDRFISLLNKVRDNQLDDHSREVLNSRYQPNFEAKDEEGYITLCTHNAKAKGINDDKLRKLEGEKRTYVANLEGRFPDYAFPTEFELELKPGAQVMFVKNDPEPEKRFYNGKIGIVTRVEDEMVGVKCAGEEEEIKVTPLVWKNVKYSIDKENAEIKEELEGSFSQIPLKAAWAITIHKSQGLTFEKAIIDAETSFAHGQVYGALSRCKTLEGMVLLSPISSRSIINDKTVDGFIHHVQANQPGSTELEASQQAFQKEQLEDLFRFGRIRFLVRSVNRVVTENEGSFTGNLLEVLRNLSKLFHERIYEVAEKFQSKIQAYINIDPDVELNQELQERLKKAAAYFSTIMDEFMQVLMATDLDIDNSKVKSQLKSYLADIQAEMSVKHVMFRECLSGFQTERILNARAKTILENSKTQNKRGKAKEIVDLKNIPNPELFEQLRSYRLEKSTELHIPPYRIFSQKTLAELVHYLPRDSKALEMINGMGAKKVSAYGKDILQLIDHYCRENQIQTVEIPVQTKKAKKERVHTRQISYELFRAGKKIEEIADERGLTGGTISGHLAYYLKNGEIDISELMENGKVEKIVGYFQGTENHGFKEAKHELGEAITYEEIRLAYNHYQGLVENKSEPEE